MRSVADTFTDTAADRVRAIARADGATLTEILATRAAHRPDALAFRFVDYSVERGGVDHDLTYAQLDARVSAVAARLSELTAPGDRVAVLTPQGLPFVVGFLGALRAGRIAVPLFSPDLPGHGERLEAVVADCRPAVALATAANETLVREFAAGLAAARADDEAFDGTAGDVAVLTVDALDPAAAEGYRAPSLSPDDVAYLQYTSGSTRLPAGVRITHANVVVNCAQALVASQPPADSCTVSWLPLFHDMGLVFSMTAMVHGVPAVLLDPIAFLMKPARWLQLMSRHPHPFSAAPNFAFDFCAARIPEHERAELDLSGVSAILNGAEPVQLSTLTRFQDVFGPQGLRPGAVLPSYGLAEATVYCTAKRPEGEASVLEVDRDALAAARAVPAADGAPSATLVGCGFGTALAVAIADPASGQRKPDGDIGEIWLDGPNVGDGYWGRPEATEQVFGQILLEPGELSPAGWLRTGDLGFVHDGELFVTGRIKDLLIIDGRNHYPHDLEHTLETAHEALGRHRSAAFSIRTPDGERAVVVAEISRHQLAAGHDPAQVIAAVRKVVSREHGVSLHDVALIPPDTIPRTTSGKIARAASRTAYEQGRLAPLPAPPSSGR